MHLIFHDRGGLGIDNILNITVSQSGSPRGRKPEVNAVNTLNTVTCKANRHSFHIFWGLS